MENLNLLRLNCNPQKYFLVYRYNSNQFIYSILGPEDKYITEDGIDGTFLRNFEKLNHHNENTESVEELMKEFFEYCSKFDFAANAICLNEAVTIRKPEFCPMYIVNPLEKGLNVSKNVSLEEVERLKVDARTALWNLEAEENKDHWGLLRLIEDSKKNVVSKMRPQPNGKQDRLMDVTTLFEEVESNETEKIEFKSPEVKSQIEEIKKHTKEQLKMFDNVQSRRQQINTQI